MYTYISMYTSGLTPKGVEQCAKLRRDLQNMAHGLDVELLVVSPLTRTLQTARLTVGRYIDYIQ